MQSKTKKIFLLIIIVSHDIMNKKIDFTRIYTIRENYALRKILNTRTLQEHNTCVN